MSCALEIFFDAIPKPQTAAFRLRDGTVRTKRITLLARSRRQALIVNGWNLRSETNELGEMTEAV